MGGLLRGSTARANLDLLVNASGIATMGQMGQMGQALLWGADRS
jgi:hypothetical protein